MPEILKLQHLKPIASGRTRLVYPHPEDAHLVVKVFHPVGIARYLRRNATVPGFGPGQEHVGLFLRELREQLAIYSRNEPDPHFLETIVGIARTDMGPGLVAAAVRGHDGGYAPTLRTIVAEGRFSAQVRRNLEGFFDQIMQSDVVVGGLTFNNLLYAYDDRHGDHFVLVDGLGERTSIPFNSISRILNRISKRRRIKRFYARTLRRTGASLREDGVSRGDLASPLAGAGEADRS
jgi:hypothetical protein